jgi:hypothetical protein
MQLAQNTNMPVIKPGARMHLWVANTVSDVGEYEFPILGITIPTGKINLHELIVRKLITPLNCNDSDDVIVFYTLIAALVLSSENECSVAKRVALVREFETGGYVAALPLLRIGRYLPVAGAIRQWMDGNGVVNGQFELNWTN